MRRLWGGAAAVGVCLALTSPAAGATCGKGSLELRVGKQKHGRCVKVPSPGRGGETVQALAFAADLRAPGLFGKRSVQTALGDQAGPVTAWENAVLRKARRYSTLIDKATRGRAVPRADGDPSLTIEVDGPLGWIQKGQEYIRKTTETTPGDRKVVERTKAKLEREDDAGKAYTLDTTETNAGDLCPDSTGHVHASGAVVVTRRTEGMVYDSLEEVARIEYELTAEVNDDARLDSYVLETRQGLIDGAGKTHWVYHTRTSGIKPGSFPTSATFTTSPSVAEIPEPVDRAVASQLAELSATGFGLVQRQAEGRLRDALAYFNENHECNYVILAPLTVPKGTTKKAKLTPKNRRKGRAKTLFKVTGHGVTVSPRRVRLGPGEPLKLTIKRPSGGSRAVSSVPTIDVETLSKLGRGLETFPLDKPEVPFFSISVRYHTDTTCGVGDDATITGVVDHVDPDNDVVSEGFGTASGEYRSWMGDCDHPFNDSASGAKTTFSAQWSREDPRQLAVGWVVDSVLRWSDISETLPPADGTYVRTSHSCTTSGFCVDSTWEITISNLRSSG